MDPADQRSQPRQDAKTTSTAKAQQRPLLRADRSDDGSTTTAWVRWKIVFIIYFSLFAGLALALGHHFMYNNLNGKPVASISVSQSWIFRFGTAFAFLVKVAFGVSVGASYVQYQWHKFQRQSFRVDEIDSLTGVADDVLAFFYTHVFVRQPVLLLVAIIAWTIPFAAVVTPGALTVEPARNISTVHSYVPQPAYNATYFGNITYEDNIVTAGALLYKLAYNTAAAGQPVALSSEFQNETYSLTFDGPAVKCVSASQSLVQKMSKIFDTNKLGGSAYQYASWVPGKGNEPAMPGPSALEWTPTLGHFGSTLDETSDDAARIFVMTNTGYWTKTVLSQADNYTDHAMVLNVTECQLYNATYEVDFAFQYPNQTRHISISKWLHPIPPPTWDFGYNYRSSNATASKLLSYMCMMQAFGKLLVGYSKNSQYDQASLAKYSSWQIMDIDWSRGPAVQSGLEALFQNLTLSMLSNDNLAKSKSDTKPIPVTVTAYPITYTYAAWELLLAYGLAFLFTLLCAAIGSYAFLRNDASYQNAFSSFIRATSGHEVHAMLGPDSNGADPLPADVARVKISMSTTRGKLG